MKQITSDGQDFRDFVVFGGCAVCDGPMTVRATPGTMRGWCARCGWISRPVLMHGNGRVAVSYPPRAAA
ncbi:MAG: hypothetical protein WCK73_08985 [Deltaproteobacteria bacterium]